MNDHEKIQPLLAAYECGILSPEQQKDVESHVLGCDLCFEDLYEFAPAAQEMRRQRLQSGTFRKPRREVYRFLMAAVLVVTAAAGIWFYRLTTVTEEPVLRGSDAITQQSPREGQQLAAPPVLFRWRDSSNADEYLLSIYNEEGRLVHQQRTKTTEYLWQPGVIPPGIYRWKVEAYLTDGTRTSSSKVSEFRLK